jgi:hypothetical protein
MLSGTLLVNSVLLACPLLKNNDSNFNSNNPFSSCMINQGDSVMFDLSLATVAGTYTYIPVYFLSDDTIHSLDFALRYNVFQLEFDSVIDMTGNLQYLYHINPADSVLRFTSNSLNPMPPGVTLVTLKFAGSVLPVCLQDFWVQNVWLNGDVCSAGVRECVLSSDPDMEDIEVMKISAMPNPVSDVLRVTSTLDGDVDVYDLSGRIVHKGLTEGGVIEIDVRSAGLETGLYFLILKNALATESVRFQVVR